MEDTQVPYYCEHKYSVKLKIVSLSIHFIKSTFLNISLCKVFTNMSHDNIHACTYSFNNSMSILKKSSSVLQAPGIIIGVLTSEFSLLLYKQGTYICIRYNTYNIE